MKKSLIKKIKSAPIQPGCYIWKDIQNDILYIGKAVNIRNRVNNYYSNYPRLDPKIQNMVDQVGDVEFLTVDSEVEALILETNLIKKYKPKYNRLMKDDKNYSWIEIDWYRNFPSIKIVRDKNDKKAEYYGPYPERFPIYKVLSNLRKIFPYCDHLPKYINNKNFDLQKLKMLKPCFNYHINLCSGVCAGKVSKTSHRKNIKSIRDFLKGNKLELIERFQEEMNIYVKERKYENAALLRDKINALEYVTQRIRIDKEIDDILLNDIKVSYNENALEDLVERLKIDNLEASSGFKIECYDISNIQGTNAVGSMVVFVDGKSAKNLYRKFKIKTKNTPDDFAMMQEVLTRRFKYLKKEKVDESLSNKPNLIIVDGGKGQLSSAYEILCKMDLDKEIPIVGLAKREEEIFKIRFDETNDIFSSKQFLRVMLPRNSKSLYLVQRIRDEAHRFAIGYHRTLRSKQQTKSLLVDIPGVGRIIQKRLIEAFGSIDGIKKARKEEISAIVKNKRTVEALVKILQL